MYSFCDIICICPLSFFRELAERGKNVQVEGIGRNTALHWAAGHNKLHLVKYLVEDHKADVNIKNKFLATPLHFAVTSGSTQVVEYLIQKRAIIDVKDKNGDTPLQIACRYQLLQATGKI